jgi:Rhodanese-like domain
MFKFICLSLMSVLSFNLFSECNFEKGECPVKEEFKKFILKEFKGKIPAPTKDPVDGLKYLEVDEAIKYIGNDKYVFIDTRPSDFMTECSIKGAANYLFGVPTTPDNTLTKEIVKGFIDKGKIVVFYCNSIRCYRSLNAAIQAYAWGFPKEKIMWFGKGAEGVVNGSDYAKYLNGNRCSEYKK